jgi:hypothetical protein
VTIVLAAFPASRVASVAAPQRRALGTLFLFLAVLFAGIAYAAVVAGVWVIAVAGAVLALWIGSFGLRALMMRRVR